MNLATVFCLCLVVLESSCTPRSVSTLIGIIETNLDILATAGTRRVQRLQLLNKIFKITGVDIPVESTIVTGETLHSSFLKTTPKSLDMEFKAEFLTGAAEVLAVKFGFTSLEFWNLRFSVQTRPMLKSLLSSRKCSYISPIDCTAASQSPFRTADGTCNNLDNPLFGSAGIPFNRLAIPTYDDVVGNQPRTRGVGGKPLPSPRTVSRIVHTNSTPGDEFLEFTHMIMQWGQWVDHDFTETPMSRGKNNARPQCCPNLIEQRIGLSGLQALQDLGLVEARQPTPCFNIDIPQPDPAFPDNCMNFQRSSPTPNSECFPGYREQMNAITAYIDASNVYGSNSDEQLELRLLRGNGQLRTLQDERSVPVELGPLLPSQSPQEGGCLANLPVNTACSIAGDVRSNEQTGLTSMHTIWVRQHNLIATTLRKLQPNLPGEEIFQQARKIVGAYMQVITFKDWLPLILGDTYVDITGLSVAEKGFNTVYDPFLDASIANEFATFAFRMGHTLINRAIRRQRPFSRTPSDPLLIGDAFNNPAPLFNSTLSGVGGILFGMTQQRAQKFDRLVTDQMTERLFQNRFDIVSLNINRGRDHGIPGYVDFLELCGFPFTPVAFDQLKLLPQKTRDLYKTIYADVRDIDPFSAIIAETPAPGAVVGPTTQCIIGRQFLKLKKGDRFYFENGDLRSKLPLPNVADTSFTAAQVDELRKISLSRVLCDTLRPGLKRIQVNAFKVPGSGNPVAPCDLDFRQQIPRLNLSVFVKQW